MDFAISFAVLLVLMAYYHIVPTAAVIWLPLFTLLAVLTALGVGLWLSALNAMYRDVRYVVPFLVQFWMFASPVAYPSSLVPEKWRWLYGLNPMAGVIEGFRWALDRARRAARHSAGCVFGGGGSAGFERTGLFSRRGGHDRGCGLNHERHRHFRRTDWESATESARWPARRPWASGSPMR